MTAQPLLTTERRLGTGQVIRQGTQAGFREVAELEGEPHLVRADLSDAGSAAVMARGEPIACLAHVTDLHLVDAQSPARFEFLNREWRDPRFRELLTMHRPQEMLNMHAVEAMVRTINRVDAGPLTGLPVQLVAMTGDAIDNAQYNEFTNFLALMSGGVVNPDSGKTGYEGVQLPGWPSEYCWKPDGPPDGDQFQSWLGFPRRPGLLEQAVETFHADGLRMRWLGCYGNHEQMCQGVGIVTPALAAAMTGSQKPIELPRDIDADRAFDTFVVSPERFQSGRSIEVAPDPARRPISRLEFMSALGCNSYYVHDVDRVRFIALDTVCDAGAADGTIDEAQLRWLEQQLVEAGERHVVVLSHHGYEQLSNSRGRQRAGELLALLLRFPKVVLWLNGHIHANRVTPRGGFWEVTTGSLVDWPCQGRLVEIFETRSKDLAIGCTMIDHDGVGLAGFHRELAGNVPFHGFDSGQSGRREDRNVILLLPPRCA